MAEAKRPEHPRYSLIPARAITDPTITAQALRVLALLGRHTDNNGWCRRSQVRMAAELGCSRGTVQNALDILVGPYVDKREENRPGVAPKEGRHPHCSYSYRVRLDLPDEAAECASDGASQLAPDSANQQARGASPDQHGVPTSLAPLTERPLGNDPLGNSLAPAVAGETERSTPVPKIDRWKEFRSAIADTWPDGFPAKDFTKAEAKFRQHCDLGASPTAIIAGARLHGVAETKRKTARRGDGKFFTKLPSTWISERGWVGYVEQLEQDEAQETAVTIGFAKVRISLGDGIIEILRRVGLSDLEISSFDGMTFDEGPPPRFITPRPFHANRLRERGHKLEKELGEGLQIVVAGTAMRKSA